MFRLVGSRQASSLVEIPTARVRFPYPTSTLIMDCYNPAGCRLSRSFVMIDHNEVNVNYSLLAIMMPTTILLGHPMTQGKWRHARMT